LVLAAVFGGVFWLMNQTNQTSKIGVVTSSPALTSTLKASSDADQRYISYSSTAAAKRAMADEDLDGVLTISTQPTTHASLIERTDGNGINQTQLQSALAQAHTKEVA
ncbi:ABC transporter permease, partial [Streptococcus thermophilus]|nr:ABC transporter permease [Streptococcus thermophilus]